MNFKNTIKENKGIVIFTIVIAIGLCVFFFSQNKKTDVSVKSDQTIQKQVFDYQ